jgi:hypothetical protein
MSLKLYLWAAIFLIGFEMPAKAHDTYSHLKDRLGNSCCNNTDCRPAPYRVTPAGVQMLVDGNWIAVPDHTVQYRALPGDTGETGGGHWCGDTRFMAGPGWHYPTFCAILPPNTAAVAEPSVTRNEGGI